MKDVDEILENAEVFENDEGWNDFSIEQPTLCIYYREAGMKSKCTLEVDKECPRKLDCEYRTPHEEEELDIDD